MCIGLGCYCIPDSETVKKRSKQRLEAKPRALLLRAFRDCFRVARAITFATTSHIFMVHDCKFVEGVSPR